MATTPPPSEDDSAADVTSGSSAATKSSRLEFMLRALRYPNYRLFFSGQIVSLVGTWMTQIAMTWLVYRLTQSALMLGLVAFASRE